MNFRYPIVFCVIVLPLSVVRWMSFKHINGNDSIPDEATFVGVFSLALSGALNSGLYLLTRRRLLLGDGRPKDPESTARALFRTETPASLPTNEMDIHQVHLVHNFWLCFSAKLWTAYSGCRFEDLGGFFKCTCFLLLIIICPFYVALSSLNKHSYGSLTNENKLCQCCQRRSCHFL